MVKIKLLTGVVAEEDVEEEEGEEEEEAMVEEEAVVEEEDVEAIQLTPGNILLRLTITNFN